MRLTAIFLIAYFLASLTATLTPAPAIYADDPLPDCTDHDVTVWHGKTDTAGTCDYHHEHGDDPALADGVFGPTRLMFTNGQSLGYPWLTSEAENHEGHKHEFHKCVVDLNRGASGSYYVSDLRICAHQDGNAGATVRYHSAIIETRICRTSDGYCWIQGGGLHPDYNVLTVDPDGQGTENPISFYSQYGAGCYCAPEWGYNFRQHNGPDAWGNQPPHKVTWVQQLGHKYAAISWLTNDAFGPTDPDDPSNLLITCTDWANCQYDNSNRSLYGLRLWTPSAAKSGPAEWAQIQPKLDPDGDGYLWGFIYTNPKTGSYDASCTQPSSTCAPWWFLGAPTGLFIVPGGCCGREYDTGPGELRWPN